MVSERFPRSGHHDVIIVGAGVVGSAVAMALGERKVGAVVLDPDLSGRLSSSEKNAGGVRATWWQPVNIRLCLASVRYYEAIRDEVGFEQKGYLWLYGSDTWESALVHLDLQRRLGHRIDVLTPAQVGQRVTEIDRLDGIAGATFAPRDGLINPNLLKLHYQSRARSLGARFVDRVFVFAIHPAHDEVILECWQADEPLSDSALSRMMAQDERGSPQGGRLLELRCSALAICAGAWSPNLLKLAALDSPTEAVRRQVCLVHNRATNLAEHGMIVDTSGLYFHNEGPYILAGYSPPEEPPGYSFRYDGEDFFNKEIWPRMFARMTCCERLRHIGGWAGLYAVTPDRSAIIGLAAARIFEAHSFSGRGVMQSYAAGQELASLIATGQPGPSDARSLSRERFNGRGTLVPEPLHI
jgi:sarcosine oxidase subunit beta